MVARSYSGITTVLPVFEQPTFQRVDFGWVPGLEPLVDLMLTPSLMNFAGQAIVGGNNQGSGFDGTRQSADIKKRSQHITRKIVLDLLSAGRDRFWLLWLLWL